MNTPQQCQNTGSRRRTAVGVGTGLLAGAALGLTMVAPTMSSAASDDATAEPVGIVATAQDADQAEPGSRLREVLQPLVDDATITADQADAVATHLFENRPERPGREERREQRRMRFDGDPVADIIGIDADTLRDELRNGASVADVAAANGVDVQVVVDALVSEASDHLDVDVENARLTAEEAAELLADRTERIEARVNGERPDRPEPPADPEI